MSTQDEQKELNTPKDSDSSGGFFYGLLAVWIFVFPFMGIINGYFYADPPSSFNAQSACAFNTRGRYVFFTYTLGCKLGNWLNEEIE